MQNHAEPFRNVIKKSVCLSNLFINNAFKISEKVVQFKLGLIDKVNKLIPNSEVLKSTDLEIYLCDHNSIDVIYPGVGHNLDLINKFANQNQITINYIYREEDLKYWNYAKSGFYKFKTSFYRHCMI